MPDEAAIVGSEGREIFSERKGLNLFQNKASPHKGVGERPIALTLQAQEAVQRGRSGAWRQAG